MAELDRSTRRKLFYAMAFLFAVVAPLVILHSRGYVLNLGDRELISTGGIFIKVVQPSAAVFVDAVRSRETSFFSRGTLITNLLPKRYTVRVEKAGFQPWQKVVRVSDREVLEFREIFLPPATMTPRLVYAMRSPAPARLTSLAGRPELGLEVGDPSKPFTVFIVEPEALVARINLIRVWRWFWDDRAQAFFIGRQDEDRMRWYRVALRPGRAPTEEPITFRGLPSGFSADAVQPHPTRPEEFFFSAGGALFLQGKSSVPVPIAEQVHAYAVTPDRLYFISRNGFFVESNLEGRDVKILGRKGLFLDEDRPARFAVAPDGSIAVFDSAGGLFLYRPGRDQELGLIAGNIAGVDFSASGERMLLHDGHRLWIYWLADNPNQPFDLARTKKQIFYSETPIRQAFLNAEGSYVFFSTDQGIRMVEVDGRAGTNSYDLVRSPVAAFAFDKQSLTLSWVEGQRVLQAGLR